MPNHNAAFPVLCSSAPSSMMLPARLCPMDNTELSDSSKFVEAPSIYADSTTLPAIGSTRELPGSTHTPRAAARTLPILPGSSRLQTLQLHAPAYIPSTLFPDLTHLSISSASARNTLGHLLAFLEKTPRLESLRIVDYTLASSADVSLNGCRPGRVHLPRLRTFSLKETHAIRLHLRAKGQARISAFQRMLVAHLVIPPSCKIEMGVLAVGDLEPITKGLFDPAVRATHMYFEGSRPSRLGDLAGWTITLLNAKDKLDASFSLAHLVPDHMEDPRKIACGADKAQSNLRAALASLPVFYGIRNLWICADTLWGLHSPNSFLPSFERLEFLVLYERFAASARDPSESAYTALKTILEPLAVATSDNRRVACPSLKMLVVDQLQPSLRGDGTGVAVPIIYKSDSDVECHPSVREALEYVQSVVCARREAGHPLAQVVVSQNEAAPDGSTPVRIGSWEYAVSGACILVPSCIDNVERFKNIWAKGTFWSFSGLSRGRETA